MLTKEEVLAEIYRQELPFDQLSEQMQKSLIVSIRMKSVYDPLPEAVQKAYLAISKGFHDVSREQSP